MASTLPRRCLSSSDLATIRSYAGPVHDQPSIPSESDSEDFCETFKPIKRSRSDQSLPALDQYAAGGGAAATTTAGTKHAYRLAAQYGSKHNSSAVLQATMASNNSSSSALGTLTFTRSQRLPSLPVVLSDIGSSTNSLLSLDSDVTSQVAGGSSSPAAAQAASSLPSASSASGAAGLTPADTALLWASSNKRSSSTAALCSMYSVSSAASLSQLSATQQDLYRTASDTSIGSGSYLIQLQQLVPPLPPYSPPPLFSPGPVSASNLSTLLFDQGGNAADPVPASSSNTRAASQPGLSGLLKGVSIQQQKKAGFAALGAPIAQSKQQRQQQQQGVRGSSFSQVNSSSRTQAPGSRRSLPAVSSIDSITSVEAGEHALGFAFVHQRGLASPSVPVVHQRLQRDHTSPTAAGSSASPSSLVGQQHLPFAGGTVAQQLDAQATNAVPRSPSGVAILDPYEPVLADMTAAGLVLSPSSAASNLQSDSPSVQLQAMGSMLGNEGEQWLLPEISTGAIGMQQGLGTPNTSVQAAATGNSMATGVPAEQQLRGTSAQCKISKAMASPAVPPVVAVSSALPAGVGGGNLPGTAIRSDGGGGGGSFGFWFGKAAAAAKLNLFQQAATGGQGPSSSTLTNSDCGHPGMLATGEQSPPGMMNAAPAAAATAGGDGSRSYRATASDSGTGVAMWSAPLPQEVTAGQIDKLRNAAAQRQQQQQWQQAGPAAPWQFSQLHQQQFPAAPFRAAAVSDGHWDYSRRAASFDCARGSRRRGSLELNMPWRSRLDAVIARVAAEATDKQTSAAAQSEVIGKSGTTGAALGTEDLVMLAGLERAAAAATAAADPFSSSNGSSGTSGGWHQQLVFQQRRSRSKLDLLQPLLESEPAAGSSNTSSQRQSAEAAAGMHDSLRRARSSSSSGSSNGASVAADHDMPGSTNSGGYIGGSDGIGLTGGRSYGLEFDGAVVMESIGGDADEGGLQNAPGGPGGLEGSQLVQREPPVDGSAERQSWEADVACPEQKGAEVLQQQQHASHDTSQQWQQNQRQHHLQQHLEGQGPQQHRHLQEQVVVVVQDQSLEEEANEQQQQQEQQQGAATSASADLLLDVHSPTPVSLSHAGASAFSPVAPSGAAGAGRPLAVSPTGAGPGSSRAGSGAAYELFVRLKCARQTLEFATRQAEAFAELDKAELGVWEALDLLNGMREYEAVLLSGLQQGAGPGGSVGADEALTPDMSLQEHALQVAELCRLSFPDKPWMALVGLLHGLGKLLAHPMWKSQPQWAVAGESFPVGCRFAPQISHSEFLSANPDRRRRTYSTALGVYQEHCGLRNVYMSWGAPEYLYMMLVLNQTALPEEALFLIRYQRCAALTRPGGAYRQLMRDADRALLPLLAAFQSLITYKRVQLPPEALKGEELIAYYDRLIGAYLGEEKLFW